MHFITLATNEMEKCCLYMIQLYLSSKKKNVDNF